MISALERRIRRLNDRYQAAKAAGHSEAFKRRATNLSRVYLELKERSYSA